MRNAYGLFIAIGLSSCSALPHDGPSSQSVRPLEKQVSARANPPAAVIDLSYGVTQTIATHPPEALTGLQSASSTTPTDLIAEGDALAISVFEAGSSELFARPGQGTGVEARQTFPRLVVDRNGSVMIPFAGEIHLAGQTPGEAAETIRRALRRLAIDPQVTVTVTESRANSAVVIGEVRASGHFALAAHNDLLLDVLASAGGPTRPLADLVVSVSRGGRQADIPFSVLMADPKQNIRLAPQDQVRVLYRPQKYSTFGALSRDSETAIEDEPLTLAAAISRAGGLDTNSANAASVMVFRFERPDVARALGVTTPPLPKGVPIIYRLNLRKPEGFFIANNFTICPNDLLYVPRSDITEAKKFLDLVNTVTQVTYNVRVTSVVP